MVPMKRFGLCLVAAATGPALADEVAPPAVEVARPTADDARLTARTWLAGLRDQTPDKIIANTVFPLAVEGIGPSDGAAAKRCRAFTVVKDAKAAAALWKCLFADKALAASLPADLSLAKWRPIVGEPPPQFERKREKLMALERDHTLVEAALTGDGINHLLLFAVKTSGKSSGVDQVFASTEKEGKAGTE